MSSPEPQKSLAVVGAVFFDTDCESSLRRVLAFRRGPNKVASGLWEFAGGKIEPGESAEQAIVREVREELNVDVTVLAEILTSTTVVNDISVTITCFEVATVGDLPDSSTDHDELRWMPIEELHTLEWIAPDVPVVAALQALV